MPLGEAKPRCTEDIMPYNPHRVGFGVGDFRAGFDPRERSPLSLDDYLRTRYRNVTGDALKRPTKPKYLGKKISRRPNHRERYASRLEHVALPPNANVRSVVCLELNRGFRDAVAAALWVIERRGKAGRGRFHGQVEAQAIGNACKLATRAYGFHWYRGVPTAAAKSA